MATPSLFSNILGQLKSNKRLFGLMGIAFLVIGTLGATYYYHIESNKLHFLEYKLQTLDSHYDIISRQIANDVQTYYATQESGSNDSIHDSMEPDSTQIIDSLEVTRVLQDIWEKLDKLKKPLALNTEFDEYILVFKFDGRLETKEKRISSLKGLTNVELDSLLKSNPLNIGVSMPIPKEEAKYQLFAREYELKPDIKKGLIDDDEVTRTDIKIELAIIGLVGAEKYQQYTRKLDSWIIALLTTFLLLCLFGLPYFKMIFIAEDERLFAKDVIMASTAVIVGAPVIVAIFLSLVNYYEDYYVTIPDRLERMNEKIVHQFETENTTAVYYLNKLNLTNYDIEVPTLGENVQFFPIPEQDSAYRSNFKYVTKVDTDGNVFYHMNLIKKPPEGHVPTKLGNRIYFEDIKNSRNVWESDGVKYVMRPVVSVEDQTEEAVYIVFDSTAINTRYRVGSAQLKSIHDPVLPFGYQFAIVDDKGEVWFHSEEGRSTLENFFTVSRQFMDLKAAINGRVGASGLLKYRDESQLYRVAPLTGTNLSVITLYDLGLLRVKVSEVLSVAGITIFLAFLLIVLLTAFSVLIKKPKHGLFKYRSFIFEFLTPKKESCNTYTMLSIFFGFMFILCLISSYLLRFLPSTAFILSFLSMVWTYLIVYYSLHPDRDQHKLKFRIRLIMPVLAIIVLNIILVQKQFSAFALAVFIQFLSIIFLERKRFETLHKKIDSIVEYVMLKTHNICHYWYAIFLFSWLLLASIFPTYIIFEKTGMMNDMVWVKTNQLYMAETYVDKKKKLREKLKPIPNAKKKVFEDLYDLHLEKGQYLGDDYGLKEVQSSRPKPILRNPFRTLFWESKPIYDERLRKYQGLVYQQSQDGIWSSIEKQDSILFELHHKQGTANKSVSLFKKTKKKKRGKRAKSAFLLKWCGLIFILAVLYSLILFYVDRFFGFRFKYLRANDFDTNKDEDYATKFAQVLQSKDSNSGLLLIGLPFSGKTSFAHKVAKSAGYKTVRTLSFLKLNDLKKTDTISDIFDMLHVDAKDKVALTSDWKNADAFIIENLEHNLKSYEANRVKLRLISHLISDKKRIILCSEVYPSQILALYENSKGTDEPLRSKLASDFNSWRNILSAFPQVLIGIIANEKKLNDNLLEQETSNVSNSKRIPGEIYKTVAEELGFSQFLPTLAPIILSKNIYAIGEPKAGRYAIDEQRMVMHVQNLGHGYYTDIWNSLPTRERYMLYDLAGDGFLNIKNGNSLFSLMKKGLIVWRDRPAIFNRSFKNFIISSVSTNEALRLEYKNRGEGSWGTIRILFYLVILTVIVFILLGEPGLFNDFETLVGALGGIGVIIPLIGTFLARVGHKG